MKQQYIGFYEDGQLDKSAIIHEWHDNENITLEYITYLDMIYFASPGLSPSLEKDCINPEYCEDVNLSDCKGSFKLHYTFFTLIGDFIKAERNDNQDKGELKNVYFIAGQKNCGRGKVC